MGIWILAPSGELVNLALAVKVAVERNDAQRWVVVAHMWTPNPHVARPETVFAGDEAACRDLLAGLSRALKALRPTAPPPPSAPAPAGG